MKKVIGFDEEFDLILNQLIDKKLSNSLLLTGNKGIEVLNSKPSIDDEVKLGSSSKGNESSIVIKSQNS